MGHGVNVHSLSAFFVLLTCDFSLFLFVQEDDVFWLELVSFGNKPPFAVPSEFLELLVVQVVDGYAVKLRVVGVAAVTFVRLHELLGRAGAAFVFDHGAASADALGLGVVCLVAFHLRVAGGLPSAALLAFHRLHVCCL